MENSAISSIESKHFKPKFFINQKENIISESLTGYAYQNENILYYKDSNTLVDQSQLNQEKVRLICGGGSGHEPAHGGFVMEGMLTAAVCGDIYSSPSYPNIQKAIDLVYSPKGVIILVKNYGGDIINFSLAAEIAKAQGKKVEMLIIDDDISLTNMNKEYEGNSRSDQKVFNKRRGLCGVVYLYKILGAMCQQGFSFEEILEYGKHLIPSLYTLGVSLTSSVTPFSCLDDLRNEIKYSECEIGLGIHGEQGKERVSYNSVNGLIEYCFKQVFEQNMEKNFFDFSNVAENKNLINDNSNKKDVNIVLNNLGSCTDIEMNIIFLSLKNFIEQNYKNKINVLRYFCGRYMTSLDMRGFSITICDMDHNGFVTTNKQKILGFLDAKAKSDLFKAINLSANNPKSRIICEEKAKEVKYENKNSSIKKIVFALCNYLIEKRDYLNHLDKEVADGDLGIGVERGCCSVLKNLEYLNFEEKLKAAIKRIGDLIACNYGGTSGPLFASFLIRGAESLLEKEDLNKSENWMLFFAEGTRMMQRLGKAKLGDKTMMDVLIPMSEYFTQFIGERKIFDFKEFKENVNSKLNEMLGKIKLLMSKKGRSAYQEGKEIGKDDPGCVLVSLIIKFVLESIH